MKANRSGRIVNISSGAGLGVSLTGIQAYASAKAAQIGLTRQLAHELGPFGITVNNIAPGPIMTDRLVAILAARAKSLGITIDEQFKRFSETIPVRRMGQPEEVGDLCAYLCSLQAGYLTGQAIVVDGGVNRSI
jgi:3-oxoacyl-[acyl-carrier protein] reductase